MADSKQKRSVAVPKAGAGTNIEEVIQENFRFSPKSNVVYNESEEITEILSNENGVANEKVEVVPMERVALPKQRPQTSIEEKIENLIHGKKTPQNN
ncbi:MAG: hypothetical protein IJV27_06675 [Prevotella sp.]|nr:hypothetical protein [Prevotella sp.]